MYSSHTHRDIPRWAWNNGHFLSFLQERYVWNKMIHMNRHFHLCWVICLVGYIIFMFYILLSFHHRGITLIFLCSNQALWKVFTYSNHGPVRLMQDGVHLQYNSIAGLWYDHLVVDQAVYTNDHGWEHNLPLGAVGYMGCLPSNQPRGWPACYHMNWLGDALWVNRIKVWFIIWYSCLRATRLK